MKLLLLLFPLCLFGEFHLVTVANHVKRPSFSYLLDSAAKYNMHLEVIGYGRDYKANGTKLVRMLEYVRTLPPDDIILFVDAFDVTIIDTQEAILDAFLSMDAPLVIAAERNCFPNPSQAKYFQRNQPFPFINSGCYIGYAGYIEQWLREIKPDWSWSDQGQITNHYLKHHPEIVIDHETKLFLCLFQMSSSELEITKGRVIHKKTRNAPKLLHANSSNSFPLLDHILRKIN